MAETIFLLVKIHTQAEGYIAVPIKTCVKISSTNIRTFKKIFNCKNEPVRIVFMKRDGVLNF